MSNFFGFVVVFYLVKVFLVFFCYKIYNIFLVFLLWCIKIIDYMVLIIKVCCGL